MSQIITFNHIKFDWILAKPTLVAVRLSPKINWAIRKKKKSKMHEWKAQETRSYAIFNQISKKTFPWYNDINGTLESA